MTSISFSENDKFAILPIQQTFSNLPKHWRGQLSDGTSVYTEFSIDLESEWNKLLGTLRIKSLKESNLIFVCTLESKTAGVLDHEQQELFIHLHQLFHVLQVSGVLHYEDAYLLMGSFYENRLRVQQVSHLDSFYATPGSKPVPVTLERLEEACQARRVLSEIWSTDDFRRLKYGLIALFQGLRGEAVLNRVHQFVRSLDGLVVTGKGSGMLDFRSRCQTFIKASTDLAEILEDAYNIRSAVEHLNIEQFLDGERKEKVTQRTRQMEQLASFAYSRILTDSDLRKHFINKGAQLEFWGLDDDEREELWGEQLDLMDVQ